MKDVNVYDQPNAVPENQCSAATARRKKLANSPVSQWVPLPNISVRQELVQPTLS